MIAELDLTVGVVDRWAPHAAGDGRGARERHRLPRRAGARPSRGGLEGLPAEPRVAHPPRRGGDVVVGQAVPPAIGSVSVWRSEDDLRRFVRWARHVAIMRRYRDAGESHRRAGLPTASTLRRSGPRRGGSWRWGHERSRPSGCAWSAPGSPGSRRFARLSVPGTTSPASRRGLQSAACGATRTTTGCRPRYAVTHHQRRAVRCSTRASPSTGCRSSRITPSCSRIWSTTREANDLGRHIELRRVGRPRAAGGERMGSHRTRRPAAHVRRARDGERPLLGPRTTEGAWPIRRHGDAHVRDYRTPDGFAGQHVVVVGGEPVRARHRRRGRDDRRSHNAVAPRGTPPASEARVRATAGRSSTGQRRRPSLARRPIHAARHAARRQGNAGPREPPSTSTPVGSPISVSPDPRYSV